jgi:hypothetical protein
VNARLLTVALAVVSPAAVVVTVAGRHTIRLTRAAVTTWQAARPERPDRHDASILVLAPVIPISVARQRHQRSAS